MHFYCPLPAPLQASSPSDLALSDVAALAAERSECEEPWEVAAVIEDRVII